MTDVRIRRYPFDQPLLAEGLDPRDEKTLESETRSALAKLRLRIQQVYGCNDRKAYVANDFVDVEVNLNNLGNQVKGEPTPLEKFDLGVRNAIRLGWEDNLFPGADTSDFEQMLFGDPFYVDEKGQDLNAEPKTDEEPTDEVTVAQDGKIVINPNDDLSPDEIIELLKFWRRISATVSAIHGYANFRQEAAFQLEAIMGRLTDGYSSIFSSSTGRSWSWLELQEALTTDAEDLRLIASILRTIDDYIDPSVPSAGLFLRLIAIANREPLPAELTEHGLVVSPMVPLLLAPSQDAITTDSTVPHQRSLTEDDQLDGDNTND